MELLDRRGVEHAERVGGEGDDVDVFVALARQLPPDLLCVLVHDHALAGLQASSPEVVVDEEGEVIASDVEVAVEDHDQGLGVALDLLDHDLRGPEVALQEVILGVVAGVGVDPEDADPAPLRDLEHLAVGGPVEVPGPAVVDGAQELGLAGGVHVLQVAVEVGLVLDMDQLHAEHDLAVEPAEGQEELDQRLLGLGEGVVVAEVDEVRLGAGSHELTLGGEALVALEIALVLLLVDLDVGRVLGDRRGDLTLQASPEPTLDRQQVSPGVMLRGARHRSSAGSGG